MAQKPYMPVRVQSYRETLIDGTTPCEPSQDFAKTIDWNNASDRKWFTDHLTWSLHHERIVLVSPEHGTRGNYHVESI